MREEGWSPGHDDEHYGCEMAIAAGCYAMHAGDASMTTAKSDVPILWPWQQRWWKPTTARRNLVKAAALIVAEIERLDREKEPS
jgi:hypothetical protein